MPIDFHIEDDGTVIVNCSRKAVQKMCYENYISKLSVGDIIDAHVMKIVGYGIFCDIGCGIIALLPTNSISVTHIVNPMVELKGISTLKVIVKAIREDGKIELTHKELLGTWKEQIAQFAEGDLVKGTVLSVEDYGVFIRLSQNLSGLAEVPEGLELNSGDTVSVRIQSIQDKNMKVKLSIVEKIEDNEDKTIRFKYYVNEPHITDWVYSTETAKKQISSHFE
jgi:small subunit ribosomal protein S1